VTKPVLMLSLPNSGTSWLAQTIADNWPGCRYFREYFNPVCNLKHEAKLCTAFGSELVDAYPHIGREWTLTTERVVDETWFSEPEPYTFTKEIYSPYKLEGFLRRGFHVFVMLAANVFPPSRVRVWSFYEHIWQSLRFNGVNVNERTLEGRAREAHRMMSALLEVDAASFGVPLLRYEELGAVTDAQMAACLNVTPKLGADIARAVRESFKPAKRRSTE
jgi:hypothetical protein